MKFHSIQPLQRPIMRLALSTIAIALASLSAMAAYAQGKCNLVFYSPASPEGFDNGQYTGDDTFDASGRMLFNRLVEFENGTTKSIPGLAEKCLHS